jgi:predicted amidophosphoribosyltransferase
MNHESQVCSVCGKELSAQAPSVVCAECAYKAERRTALWMAVITAAAIGGLVAVFLLNSREW